MGTGVRVAYIDCNNLLQAGVHVCVCAYNVYMCACVHITCTHVCVCAYNVYTCVPGSHSGSQSYAHIHSINRSTRCFVPLDN